MSGGSGSSLLPIVKLGGNKLCNKYAPPAPIHEWDKEFIYQGDKISGKNQYPQNIPTQKPKHSGHRMNFSPILLLENKFLIGLVGPPLIRISTIPNTQKRNMITLILIPLLTLFGSLTNAKGLWSNVERGNWIVDCFWCLQLTRIKKPIDNPKTCLPSFWQAIVS